MKVIGIDLDDTLLNLSGTFIEFHNSKYGTAYAREEAISPFFEEVWDITKEDVFKRLHEFYNSEHYLGAEPVKGAPEAIARLAETNELYIVTASPEEIKDRVEVWLGKHFTNKFKGIHFIKKSIFDENIRNKKDVCEELGIEVFIDDALHNAEDISSAGIPVFLLDAPWNQKPINSTLVTRVHSWDDIVIKLG
jgi:uncharacterized HAD superfamily protein